VNIKHKQPNNEYIAQAAKQWCAIFYEYKAQVAKKWSANNNEYNAQAAKHRHGYIAQAVKQWRANRDEFKHKQPSSGAQTAMTINIYTRELQFGSLRKEPNCLFNDAVCIETLVSIMFNEHREVGE
jgi:hypothetical protein